MRPTASSLWLAELCPASHVLPQVRETSTAQEKGSQIHRYLERAPKVGKEAALAELPEEYQDLCAELDPADLPRGLREQALAYDLEARCGTAGTVQNRNYIDAPHLAWGTVDVLGLQERIISDYKSGRPGPAKDSLQLQALGLFAARTFYWDRVTVGHLRIDGDKLRPDFVELGPIDLAAIHERVARIYERHEQTKTQELPDVFPGSHCTMCTAAANCPATTALTRRVSEAMTEEERIVELVNADPAAAWEFLERADDAMKRLRAELKRRAAIEPIHLRNGKQLALVEVDKTRIDGKLGLPVLRDSIGDVDALCSVGKGKLEKKIGKRSAAILLDRLAAVGAIEEHTELHLRVVKREAA